jgi:hypothetical protein
MAILLKNRLGVVQCIYELVPHPISVAKFQFVLLLPVSRNRVLKYLAHVALECILPNDIPQSQEISIYVCERCVLKPLLKSVENYSLAFLAWFICIACRSRSPHILLCGLFSSL